MLPVFLVVSALLVCGAAIIQPYQYTLQLLLDTDTDIFTGNLVIDANVEVPSQNFTLHNNGLNISTVSVVQQGGIDLYQSMVSNTPDQYTMVVVTQVLTTNLKAQITITYQGRVSTDQTGLFSFWDSGKKFYMTNFYPIYARKVFPCIDEPSAAAHISLSLIVTKNTGNLIGPTSQSQSPVHLSNGYTQYELSNTVAIAPYSFFFTLGDWNSDAYYPPYPRSKLWLPPSLQSEPNRIDPGLASALTTSNMSFLSEYVDHLDIFVAPVFKDETYSGLNTVVLRKDVLIKNTLETTTEMERDHLLKISCALWKLFFGTTLRPADWGNSWLGTSLPMYLAYKTLDEPQFAIQYGKSDENLVPGLYEKVFDACSTPNSPVVYLRDAPTNPEDILSFIQSSGVEKGVYALTTLESFVDASALRSVLLSLIVANQTVIDTPTFLNNLDVSIQTVKNVSEVMLPILSQSGYPLVQLDRNAGTLDMLKTNFVQVGSKPKFAGQVSQLADPISWILPVTVITSQYPHQSNETVYLFGASGTPVVISGIFPDEGWALLNLNGKGMMRTSYDFQSWSLLSTQARSFSPATRAKLVSDAFATAESKVQSWMSTLSFLEALDSENHLAPWKAALAGFKRMWSWIYYTGSSGNTNSTGQINLVNPFKTYVRTRLANIYKKLGPIGNNDDDKDPLRREIVAAMCEYGDPSCISNLTLQYKNMLKGVNPSNDMVSVVVCNGLRTADISVWNAAFNNYVNSGIWYPQPLINSHYSSLACPDSDDKEYSEQINSFLSTFLLNSGVKVDQILPALNAILDKPQHVDQVLEFFVNNQTAFNLTSGLQAEVVTEIGKRLTSPTQVQKLSGFLKNHNVTSDITAAVTAAIAAGNAKAQYILGIQDDVRSALAGDTPTTTTTPLPSPGSSTNTPGTTPTTASPPPSTTPGAASTAGVSLAAVVLTVVVALLTQ